MPYLNGVVPTTPYGRPRPHRSPHGFACLGMARGWSLANRDIWRRAVPAGDTVATHRSMRKASRYPSRLSLDWREHRDHEHASACIDPAPDVLLACSWDISGDDELLDLLLADLGLE
jgi:hypothetical protein